MSGDAYACHILYQKMLKARSDDAKLRAKRGEKHPDFRDE
jgi:hypothetical protein